MSRAHASGEDQARQARYEIRVRGHLDDRWAVVFVGLALTRHADGSTVLTGAIDQAGLHGVLRRIRDLGMPLHSIARLGTSAADAGREVES